MHLSYLPPETLFTLSIKSLTSDKVKSKICVIISMQIMIENYDIRAPDLQINEVYDFEIVMILNRLLIFYSENRNLNFS